MLKVDELASAVQFYQPLQSMCVASLRNSLNPVTQLYDRQLRDGTWQATRGTEALTSSCICLIAIHRAGIGPREVRLDPGASLDAICRLARKQRYTGAAGLVLWAHAVWDGLPITAVCQQIGIPVASLSRLFERLTSMELAWLVSGLIHQQLRSGNDCWNPVVDQAVESLIGRFVEQQRLMPHATSGAPAASRLRRDIANFADQIYPVQALSFVAIHRDDAAAQRCVRLLVDRLIGLQGPRGQWWWQYNVRCGAIAQHYPVYSVHQHGMAPMALSAAHRACDVAVSDAILTGQAWLVENESGRSLVDSQVATIWRDVEWSEGNLKKTMRGVQAACGKLSDLADVDPASLEINYETRPYEWAWCLYAQAILSGHQEPAHLC